MIPEKMKSVVVTGVHEVSVHEYPVPAFHDDQVLVQVKRASICTIDQRPYDGKVKSFFPRVGGHEGAGVVVAVGANVKGFKVGDKVTVGRIHCGVCQNCILGLGHCEHGPNFSKPSEPPTLEAPFNLMGCFSQYIARKANEIHRVPDEVDFEYASVVEPLSDVVHSVRRSRLAMGETCVVLGAGIMGLLHVQVARSIGARVILVELDPARRERAREVGADFVIDPNETDPAEAVRAITQGRGADVVFYIMSGGKLFDQYYEMLAVAGRMMVYSNQIPDEPHPIRLGRHHTMEREIIGTASSVDADFYRALRLIQFGKVDISRVINRSYALGECKQAYDDACVPNTYRCVIRMDEE